MEKLNIAEILKDCPKGMELDCTMYDSVQLKAVMIGDIYPIKIQTPEGIISLTKNGCYSINPHCKCVIFPKGKTTWEGFQRPFKDGDVIVSDKGDIHLLRTLDSSYCAFRVNWLNKLDRFITTGVHVVRFATEEEKQKLFDAIKAGGYKWNAETKTLEKLEKEKFDITTLKPFDKVLVRDTNGQVWTADLFSHVLDSIPRLPITFVCVARCPNQCIPYESNEHLLGTTINCDHYYKTWE